MTPSSSSSSSCQLFHADVFITEQAERIEALEAELARLRTASGNT